jgi:two-component system chemotaxis sensor kinase CheA
MGRRLQDATENAGRHIETLQHRSMEIRMLPLALVLNTLPRAVRDLSRQFGKKVAFTVKGEQTTIDKRILEQIGDPLIHLLRRPMPDEALGSQSSEQSDLRQSKREPKYLSSWKTTVRALTPKS